MVSLVDVKSREEVARFRQQLQRNAYEFLYFRTNGGRGMKEWKWDPQPGEKTAGGIRTIHDRLAASTPGFVDAPHWKTKERAAHRIFALTMTEAAGGEGLTYKEVRESLNLHRGFRTAKAGSRIVYVVEAVLYEDGLARDWVETQFHRLFTDGLTDE